jgi:hypothetical protein
MTNTHTPPDAAQVAKQYRGHIVALQRYLARVGVRPEVVNPAVAEAIAQLVQRPDITRPMAYISTVARGEAERLTAELDAAEAPKLTAPDLMAVIEGKGKPRQRRSRRAQTPARKEGQLFNT